MVRKHLAVFFCKAFLLLLVLCHFSGCKEDPLTPEPILYITPKITGVEIVTDTGFKFNWTYPVNAIGFVYEVSKEIDFSSPITGEVPSATYEIDGLESSTLYHFRAKALYPGGESNFSGIESVQTLVSLNRFTLTTKDGYNLAAGISYPEQNTQGNPAIILLHQLGSDKEEWHNQEIYSILNQSGYVTMIFDHRNHGESDINFDITVSEILSNPNFIPVDLEAALEFLKNDPLVDPERVGLMGGSMGANLACVGKGNPILGIKTGVSISARKTRVEDLSTNIDDFTLGGMYFIVGENDSDLEQLTIDLFLMTEEPKLLDVIEGSSSHGSLILVEFPEFNDRIMNWLEDHL